MTDAYRYAVYLVDQVAEVLGPVVQPFIKSDASGDHFLATEVDTGGAFCELTLVGQDAEGKTMTIELMIPMGMIRMVISIVSDGKFGFDVRPPAVVVPQKP